MPRNRSRITISVSRKAVFLAAHSSERMRKALFISLMAFLASALGEVAFADDPERNSPQLQSVELNDPSAGGAIASEREWEYLAALQKCEILVDAEKTKCVEAVRENFGEM